MSEEDSYARRYASVLGCLEITGLQPGLCASTQPPDFSIRLSRSDGPFSEVQVVQRGPRAFTLSAAGLAACDVDLDQRSIAVRAAPGQAHAGVAHFLTDVVLPRLASREGRCLHAAAVVDDDEAFALIGPSGTGKSTLAARLCLEGASLLGDDCAHVRDGFVQPAYRPSRLWPDAALLLGLPASEPDATGKISLAEVEGVVRATAPVRLREVLVVDSGPRPVGVSEALGLLMTETMRLVIPQPLVALETAVEFLRAYGPRRTIPRTATLDDLRAL